MKTAAILIGAPTRLRPGAALTGIDKHPVDHPVMVGALGCAGDHVLNRRHHGGPDQALLVETTDNLDWFAKTTGRTIPPGLFGENLLIEGLDGRAIKVGDRIQIGEVVLEATSPRIPCATFATRMGDPHWVKRYFEAGRPGIYVRVIAPGVITSGQEVSFQPSPTAELTLAEIMEDERVKRTASRKAVYLAHPIAERLRTKLERG